MLVYHPAFDPHHCMLRMLRLLLLHPPRELPIDKLRILDFYYLFPHLLAGVSVLKGQVARKNKFAKRVTKYNSVVSPKSLMIQMKSVQDAALQTLAAKGFLDAGEFSLGTAKIAAGQPPSEMDTLLHHYPAEDREVAEYLSVEIARIPLLGEAGLKGRTGLLEHRYDPT